MLKLQIYANNLNSNNPEIYKIFGNNLTNETRKRTHHLHVNNANNWENGGK